MYSIHERNPWLFQTGSEPTLSFCLQVLQIDGLHVPPFDQHPDGDGSLRSLGLTAEDWQAWFLRASNPQKRESDVEQLRQLLMAEFLRISGEPDMESLGKRYQAEQLKISTAPPLPPLPEFYPYHVSWNGSSAVRDRLIEIQKEHKPVSSQIDRLCMDLSKAQQKEERKSGKRLYDELQVYKTRLPPLTVYFLAYDHPLDYLVPPATIIMTVQDGQPEPEEYRERVLAAAAELAALAGRHGKQSLYTRIDQTAAVYRRYARKPVPPPLPEQTMPRLSDPVRQAVLEDLKEHSFHEIVDLASVQFLREKQRPGWKLYEVTYQEIDGEQHRMIFILQQNEDGSWQHMGIDNSTDMQKQWSRNIAPIHDHPLLFLTPNWMSYNHLNYLRTAHGHVIDNGFSVARVCLTNDSGQTLEDTVEDGYVFFACKPEQLVQLPMQAELFDQQGKLVWRQTIPETGFGI